MSIILLPCGMLLLLQVPAEPDHERGAVLVCSWTRVGDGCKLGVFANVPAGTRLADGYSVYPGMTAGEEDYPRSDSIDLSCWLNNHDSCAAVR